MEKHNLPPVAAEPDAALRRGEIRVPQRDEAFEMKREREVDA